MSSKIFQGTPYTETPEASRKPKACQICGTLFIPRTGSQKWCSNECKTKNNQLNGSMSSESQYTRISGNWKRYFSRLLGRSSRKNSITTDELLALLDKQNFKCALSGIDLTCTLEKGKRFKTNASIDRINAGKEYTIDNIQLVCSALNSWRSDTDLKEFIWFCEKVTEYQRGRG